MAYSAIWIASNSWRFVWSGWNVFLSSQCQWYATLEIIIIFTYWVHLLSFLWLTFEIIARCQDFLCLHRDEFVWLLDMFTSPPKNCGGEKLKSLPRITNDCVLQKHSSLPRVFVPTIAFQCCIIAYSKTFQVKINVLLHFYNYVTCLDRDTAC